MKFIKEMEQMQPCDIIITLPKYIVWEDYEKELAAAERGEIMNFKVNAFPNTAIGKKCYLLYNGKIRGYMIISDLSTKSFTCTTTGKQWDGKFIERTGKFFNIEPIDMKGFQGFRYFR